MARQSISDATSEARADWQSAIIVLHNAARQFGKVSGGGEAREELAILVDRLIEDSDAIIQRELKRAKKADADYEKRHPK